MAISVLLPTKAVLGKATGSSIGFTYGIRNDKVHTGTSLALSRKDWFLHDSFTVAVHQRRTACSYQIFMVGTGTGGCNLLQTAPSVRQQSSHTEKSVRMTGVIQKWKNKWSGWTASWQATDSDYQRKCQKRWWTDPSHDTSDNGWNF